MRPLQAVSCAREKPGACSETHVPHAPEQQLPFWEARQKAASFLPTKQAKKLCAFGLRHFNATGRKKPKFLAALPSSFRYTLER
jgi:hypothetical protein